MTNMQVEYVHLAPGSTLWCLNATRPFAAVVVAETTVSPEWRWEVSQWLVASGCLYMMATGTDCSLWDDDVDHANLAAFEYDAIPHSSHVMTTWHVNEKLSEVFWFAKNVAQHPELILQSTVLLDIGENDRHEEMVAAYNAVAKDAKLSSHSS